MPNHVFNTVVFKGDKQVLENLAVRLAAPYLDIDRGEVYTFEPNRRDYPLKLVTPEFSFRNIVPPPLDHFDEYTYSSTTTMGWYEWNIDNWGTKWDAYDVARSTDDDPDGEVLAYSFTTAWSYPEMILKKLVEQYPQLHIEWRWEEEQGFGEELHYDPETQVLSVVEEWH